MTKLSNFWYETELLLPLFLAQANAQGAVQANLNDIKTWWDSLTAPYGAFKAKLDALNIAKTTWDMANQKRSARLLRIIQGAVGASASQSGIYATPADLVLREADVEANKNHANPNDPASQTKFAEVIRATSPMTYIQALTDTVAPARAFLDQAKGKVSTVSAALDAAVAATKGNRDKFMPPLAWDAANRLATAIREALPRIGGSGDGSAYWPSTWVSSSSGS